MWGFGHTTSAPALGLSGARHMERPRPELVALSARPQSVHASGPQDPASSGERADPLGLRPLYSCPTRAQGLDRRGAKKGRRDRLRRGRTRRPGEPRKGFLASPHSRGSTTRMARLGLAGQ